MLVTTYGFVEKKDIGNISFAKYRMYIFISLQFLKRSLILFVV